MSTIIPYSPIIIDANYQHFSYAISQSLCCHGNNHRENIQKELHKLWTTELNKNHVMPLLSVRTGLDLFLSVMKFPPRSEMIMTAINIPDMSAIVKHHGLVIVPWDVCLKTLEPKIQLLSKLITSQTVAIIVAHLYGRLINMDPIIQIAAQRNLIVIEDCAEAFNGFEYIGHPLSDISLFSFGAIKFYTSFGGAIAKVKDGDVYKKMCSAYSQYPVQTSKFYLQKVVKYSIIYSWLQVGPLPKLGRAVLNQFGVDYKSLFVKWMRGFPDQMLQMIRCQPCTALLSTMLYRQQNFQKSEFDLQREKGQYFLSRLHPGYKTVGTHVEINNFWLFPVIVDNPDDVVLKLNALGVDAYRGATQLTNIEPCEEITCRFLLLDEITLEENGNMLSKCYPQNAKYLIDHVIYLPVNKFVPYPSLDRILKLSAHLMKTYKPSAPALQGMMLKSKL